MVVHRNGSTGVANLEGHGDKLGPPSRVAPVTGEKASGMGAATKTLSRHRRHHPPLTVEATLYWWRTDERRSMFSQNQFGIMPATTVRFQCVGTLTPKYPQRYRVDLARALDWMPYLNRNELKELAGALAVIIGTQMGVDVAPISADIIDLNLSPGDQASLTAR